MALPAGSNQSEVFAVANVTYKANLDAGTLGTNLGNGGPTPITPVTLATGCTRAELVAQNVNADIIAMNATLK